MFQTARFKVHNPSRHKFTVVRYALTRYHLTLKAVLEKVLEIDDLLPQILQENKRGKQVINKYALSRIIYRIAPKDWELAPLRDYLIGDAIAMILSFLEKVHKGVNEANPPTLPSLTPMTAEEKDAAMRDFALTVDFPLEPEQRQEIESARAAGQVHLVAKLYNIFASKAERNAYRDLLRKMEAPIPRPLEFTRCELERGFLLGRKADNFYLIVRLFAKGHRHWKRICLDEGFVNWRTKEDIGGQFYPGVILPLEFGREYHELEYLSEGEPKSAKLLIKRNDKGQEEIYAHIAFEFKPEPVITETFLGLDRGGARIGAGTVINGEGLVVAAGLTLEGQAFTDEQRRFEKRIADAQRKNKRAPRLFRLRRRRADIVIGEYANRLIEEAVNHKSQLVLEDIKGKSMRAFLTRNQFQKLSAVLEYKAERVGLPKPIAVPAAYTSQTCARCGHQCKENRPHKDEAGKPIQDVFRCLQCGYAANADDNASQIIALRALHQVQNGGRYQKFSEFQEWLSEIRSREAGKAEAASV